MALELGLEGKRALVTGASSGLGAHFAALLAAEGAKVAIAARRVERLEEARAGLEAAGAAEVLPLALDVTDAASVESAVGETVQRFGGLDILVNNAGTAGRMPALETSPEDYDQVIATNLRGAWLMATGAARAMRDGGGGSVVNIASVLGIRVTKGVAPYAISKAGVVQMTKALALELARDKVRVNAIAPGYFVTDINRDFLATEAGQALAKRIPMRRFGEKEDLDGAFLLLCSERSAFMTGSVIAVDGGHLVSAM